MISTIGTHSSGQPSRNTRAMTNISMAAVDSSIDSSTSVRNLGVPRFENTAPKKLEAATRNMISTEISSVLIIAS